jgi:hypothetical protein
MLSHRILLLLWSLSNAAVPVTIVVIEKAADQGNAPRHLANAYVEVSDPATGDVIHEETTRADGLIKCLLPDNKKVRILVYKAGYRQHRVPETELQAGSLIIKLIRRTPSDAP